MAYATATQLIDRFGGEEMAARAAPESRLVDGLLLRLVATGGDTSGYTAEAVADAEAGVARLEDALATASGDIDQWLAAAGYSVPLASTPGTVRDYCLHIARWQLYEDTIPEHVQTYYDRTQKGLAAIVKGDKTLLADDGTPLATGSSTAGTPAYTTGTRVFDRDTLDDY